MRNHPRYLRRRIEELTAELHHGRLAKPLRDAIRANGRQLAWTVLAGGSTERGLLVTEGGELFEFDLPAARWQQHDTPSDILRARYPGVDIALPLASSHHLFSAQLPREVLLSSIDDLPPDLLPQIDLVSDDDARALRERAARTFTDGRSVRTDALVGDAQVTCEDSWKLIEDFEAAGPVVMFTNRGDGETMFEIASIRDAVRVVGQMHRFDFYLVDRACTYLFAVDEYDTLFGCGTAALFVARL